jgi:3D (Asp-Asp-Asp) domain-containing protein
VVVDPRELDALRAENERLQSELREEHQRRRSAGTRQRVVLQVVLALVAAVSVAACLQSTRLAQRAEEARQYRKASQRANAALTALTRTHDRILSATEQAPSVGSKSWGRRFTVTKYVPRSEAYGKFNDGLTATMMKADPDARIIAVDPKLIPYGSWVWIEDLGWYQAQDCGSAIKGFRLDVLTATEEDAMKYGRQERFVIVVPEESAAG